MENIKQIVAKNIADLRRASGLTQMEFAEKLNYSDKAVSKWERGDSLPDVAVLKQIADLFQVTLDYLVTEDHSSSLQERAHYQGRELRNRKIITGISILLVWLAATIAFVIIDIVLGSSARNWIAFLYGVPASMIICLIFNSLWFNPRRNFIFVSVLMWSILVTIHISLLLLGFNIWIIYILGIPGQAIILLWSGLKLKKNA